MCLEVATVATINDIDEDSDDYDDDADSTETCVRADDCCDSGVEEQYQ